MKILFLVALVVCADHLIKAQEFDELAGQEEILVEPVKELPDTVPVESPLDVSSCGTNASAPATNEQSDHETVSSIVEEIDGKRFKVVTIRIPLESKLATKVETEVEQKSAESLPATEAELEVEKVEEKPKVQREEKKEKKQKDEKKRAKREAKGKSSSKGSKKSKREKSQEKRSKGSKK